MELILLSACICTARRWRCLYCEHSCSHETTHSTSHRFHRLAVQDTATIRASHRMIGRKWLLYLCSKSNLKHLYKSISTKIPQQPACKLAILEIAGRYSPVSLASLVLCRPFLPCVVDLDSRAFEPF